VNRFVRFVVAGGPALVVGLWILEILPRSSPAWWIGLSIAVLGAGGLIYGITSALDRDGQRDPRHR